MTPVDMLHLNHGQPGAINGDCLRACLATILDLAADDVPHFMASDLDTWYQRVTDWLKPRGLAWLCMNWPATYMPDQVLNLHPVVMVGGKSPRGPWGHFVVGQIGPHGYRLLHDPHPSRAGIVGEPEDFVLLVRLDQVAALP